MLKKIPILLLLVLTITASCTNKKKEQELAIRELKLLEKENEFARKQAEYSSLLVMRDSILAQRSDTLKVAEWPKNIAGAWSGKVVCTESNCNDYVIGDQRTDLWRFESDSTKMVAKLLQNNKLIRVYSGAYDKDDIKLNYRADSTASKKVEITVLLNDFSREKIRGTQTIQLKDNCSAKFSVELVRSEK